MNGPLGRPDPKIPKMSKKWSKIANFQKFSKFFFDPKWSNLAIFGPKLPPKAIKVEKKSILATFAPSQNGQTGPKTAPAPQGPWGPQLAIFASGGPKMAKKRQFMTWEVNITAASHEK